MGGVHRYPCVRKMWKAYSGIEIVISELSLPCGETSPRRASSKLSRRREFRHKYSVHLLSSRNSHPHPHPHHTSTSTTHSNQQPPPTFSTATMVSFTAIVLGFTATAITGANAALCRYPYDNCGWVLASYGMPSSIRSTAPRNSLTCPRLHLRPAPGRGQHHRRQPHLRRSLQLRLGDG